MKTSFPKILFVSHDANRAGAQLFLLSIMQYFNQKGHQLYLLLLDGGILENDFKNIADVKLFPKRNTKHTLADKIFNNSEKQFEKQVSELGDYINQQAFDIIYLNTIATAWTTDFMCQYSKAKIISHIHELEFSLQMYATKENRHSMFENSTTIIACSNAVGENLIRKHFVESDKIATIHSFIDNESVLKRIENSSIEVIKQRYNLPNDTLLIGACGNTEWRKGLDLFAMFAKSVAEKTAQKIAFVWIGVKHEGEFFEKVQYEIERLENTHQLFLLSPTPDAVELLHALDIFVLTSREDPFPLVMLEAALCQKPIVGFDKTGGCAEFVETDAGFVVPYLSIEKMAIKTVELIENESLRKSLGKKAEEKVQNIYNFENSIKKIINLLEKLN